ncbi:MAG TPA: hypothetical protein VGK67_25300 [Myxococcales bacterium]|jgi:chromosome segregation ATPase
MNRRLLAVSAAALLAAGCASVQKDLGMTGPTVDDLQVARLAPDQLGQVNRMRTQVSQADQQVSRAEVGVRDAHNELNAAQAQSKVVDQQISAINARIKASTEARDQQAEMHARGDLNAAQARQQIEQARLVSAKSQVELAKAQKTYAERNLTLARAQLENTKFEALKIANDPAAGKYKPADFQNAISKAEQSLSDAQRDVAAKQASYQAAFQSWQRVQQRLTAASRPPPG